MLRVKPIKAENANSIRAVHARMPLDHAGKTRGNYSRAEKGTPLPYTRRTTWLSGN